MLTFRSVSAVTFVLNDAELAVLALSCPLMTAELVIVVLAPPTVTTTVTELTGARRQAAQGDGQLAVGGRRPAGGRDEGDARGQSVDDDRGRVG